MMELQFEPELPGAKVHTPAILPGTYQCKLTPWKVSTTSIQALLLIDATKTRPILLPTNPSLANTHPGERRMATAASGRTGHSRMPHLPVCALPLEKLPKGQG